MARCGAVAVVSTVTWRWWEAWALEGAHRAGLDYSPLVGLQESIGRQPLLPPALPNLLVVRNPLPSWIAPLVVPNSDGNSSSGSSTATHLPECSRASPHWPLANLRQRFRLLVNASDEGEEERLRFYKCVLGILVLQGLLCLCCRQSVAILREPSATCGELANAVNVPPPQTMWSSW